MTTEEHWNTIYKTKADQELSWFQQYPKTSMEFIESFDLPLDAKIIDIGGGDSRFVDALLDKGYQNIWVLDISKNAIEKAKKRLRERASKVNWVVADILELKPTTKFDLWHDRAAFHFLTTEERINNYVSLAKEGIKKDGYLILGTFSENGPRKCSGLEIKQYTEASMSSRFETAFTRTRCITEDHTTPFNSTQNFLFCSFRKN